MGAREMNDAAAPAAEGGMANGLTEAETEATASVMGLSPESREADKPEAGQRDPWQSIVQHCMVTEAVTPDQADPHGTIRRLIDYHIMMDRGSAGQREGVEDEVAIAAHWIQIIESAATILQNSYSIMDRREGDALRKLVKSARKIASAQQAGTSLGISFTIDESVPPGEVRVMQGGEQVARIVDTGSRGPIIRPCDPNAERHGFDRTASHAAGTYICECGGDGSRGEGE